jgi:transglutaminase-like putative cysteine protease
MTESVDAFGNIVVDLHAPTVQAFVEFAVQVTVDRQGTPPTAVDDWAGLLVPTRLTEPDGALAAAARSLQETGLTGWALADRANAWVAATMRYRHDVTHVGTTAAEALAVGQGVCQDYAHVMLALCRLCGLPARYVSGHLVGEGGSHAWVEVVLPPAGASPTPVAVAFDPTNDRRAGASYLTVAVGRDYADVAPTHGTYRGHPGGRLSATKSLERDDVELVPA